MLVLPRGKENNLIGRITVYQTQDLDLNLSRGASRDGTGAIFRKNQRPVEKCEEAAQGTLRKKDTLPPRPKVAEEDTTKRYLKGSGPGGQKINKTSSAVQLTHLPTGIVVKSQATRSRIQNESIARRLLAEKVEVLQKGSESRVEKKREKVSKKRRSAEKKKRRKYRKLEEGKGQSGQGDKEEGEEDEDFEDDEGCDDAVIVDAGDKTVQAKSES
ncbi:hypothetical protein LTS08_008556 [Lithohypha guttulata]|nr:hypothetical protein LTS08_008556 [Lithohypha guttulata]